MIDHMLRMKRARGYKATMVIAHARDDNLISKEGLDWLQQGPPIIYRDSTPNSKLDLEGRQYILCAKQLIRVCAFCRKTENAETEHFANCGNCMRIFYCNLECQRTHWAQHKLLCKT
jgi:hypothetical protein